MVLTRLQQQQYEQQVLAQFLLDFLNIELEQTNFLTTPAIPTIVYKPKQYIMAEAIVNKLTAKNFDTITKFGGKVEEDVDLWIRDLVAAFEMAKLESPQALQVVSGFLIDNALEWFLNNRKTIETWDEFLKAIRAAYQSPAAKQIASQKLRNRKQALNEPVTNYVTDVLRLCKIVDSTMTEPSKLDHLQHGLKSTLLKEVLRKEPTTTSQFLEYARKEEVLNSLVHTNENENSDNLQIERKSPTLNAQKLNKHVQFQEKVQESYPANERHSRSPESSYSYSVPHSPRTNRPRSPVNPRYPSQRNSSVRCYNCNKLGHISRNCWLPKNHWQRHV
jgi:hypothetical protein